MTFGKVKCKEDKKSKDPKDHQELEATICIDCNLKTSNFITKTAGKYNERKFRAEEKKTEKVENSEEVKNSEKAEKTQISQFSGMPGLEPTTISDKRKPKENRSYEDQERYMYGMSFQKELEQYGEYDDDETEDSNIESIPEHYEITYEKKSEQPKAKKIIEGLPQEAEKPKYEELRPKNYQTQLVYVPKKEINPPPPTYSKETVIYVPKEEKKNENQKYQNAPQESYTQTEEYYPKGRRGKQHGSKKQYQEKYQIIYEKKS